jgi:hypothetical protein
LWRAISAQNHGTISTAIQLTAIVTIVPIISALILAIFIV